MADVFYPGTLAADPGTVGRTPLPNAVFQVFELTDTAQLTPLPLKDQSGLSVTSLSSTSQGALPGVYVTSPNLSHNWVSGTWVWRRDSFDGAKAAVDKARDASISGASLSPAGDLSFTTLGGTVIAAGNVKGPQGQQGSNVLPTDQAIRDAVNNPASLTAEALAASYVGQGKEFLNLNSQPGVDMTGNAECGAAVQTAIDLARTKGIPLIGTGQIKSAVGLSIISQVDLSRVVLNYSGPSNTAAVTFGQVGGIVRKDANLFGLIVNLNKAAGNTGWGGVGVAGTVGLKILDVGKSRVTIPGIRGFETGLFVTSNGAAGVVDNTFLLGEIVDNKVGVLFDCPGGFTNQNTFMGGKVGHSGADTSYVAGTRCILMADGAISEVAQGNKFSGTNLESPDFVEFQLETWGHNDQFDNCSWETNTNTSRVAWRGTASDNLIIGGVQASTLIVTADPGATRNDIITATRKDVSSTLKFTGPNYDVGGTDPVGNDQPRYIRANTALVTGHGTTHPAPSAVGSGGYRYDDAKGKPLFTDGGSWYRADSYLKATRTASYAILTTDPQDCHIFNGASLTATLPDPANAAQDVRITIKNIAATALTVNSAGVSKTLDGAASQSLAQWAKATYVSDGTQWLSV